MSNEALSFLLIIFLFFLKETVAFLEDSLILKMCMSRLREAKFLLRCLYIRLEADSKFADMLESCA